MSIPPFVCNTPPPPEVCEDDRDVDDYNDIQYHLSQEEDDSNDIGFGVTTYNYSNNTRLPTKNHNTNLETAKTRTKIENHFKSKPEINLPENNLEDLTLNVENISITLSNSDIQIDNESRDSASTSELSDSTLNNNNTDDNSKLNGIQDIEVEKNDFIVNDKTEINQDGTNVIENLYKTEINQDGTNVIESLYKTENNQDGTNVIESLYKTENNQDGTNVIDSLYKTEIDQDGINVIENLYNEAVCEVEAEASQKTLIESKPYLEIEPAAADISIENEGLPTTVSSDKIEVLDQSIDDDFGDFEDFKVNTNNEPPTPIDDFNPWETEACTEPQFQATFDSSGFAETSAVETVTVDDDDDFGDFDDFRSNTNIENSTDSKDSDSVISSSLNSVNEAVINKVIYSMFEEELLEPENSNVKKLESSLSETWRHLQQVEERQPYMVNWNNSVTQKALLKALCIDSRNILFVPKWGSNTPRYAANLCTTPLQPLKPSTATESSVADPPTASTNSWIHQSSQDGQETSYAEAILLDLENLMATLDQMAHNQSALKISDLLSHACNPEESVPPAQVQPTLLTAADLDILDVPTSTNKVYTGAVHVQPIRQISLPDTHIFTPSNSETPRSKTIHYDSGPTILMPEPGGNIPAVDDDFSDFQDFKQSPENKTVNTGIASSVNSVAATKQVLEPIRMDAGPTAIKWPEPGQIKETFDVFSDFITVDSVETSIPSTSQTAVDSSTFSSVVANVTSASDDQFDDDFDNFQSAIPSKTYIENSVDPIIPTVKQVDSTVSFQISSNDPIKMKPITKDDFLPNLNTPMNNMQMETTNFNSLPPKINHSSQPASDILQPLSINSQYTNKNNSGQILQPLSLESYSQINWPNPGNLQDLSRFNPIETVPTLKNDSSSASGSKHASPARVPKSFVVDDDGWGEFVSSKPKQPKPLSAQNKPVCDEDEWSDFVSSSTVKPPNGVNTISFNVHTNQNIQKTSVPNSKSANQMSIDVPTLNYITPKSNNQNVYSNKHLNL